MKGREGKKKGRDGAINRAEIEREMDAIKIQVSSFSFEIRSYESKHFDFLRRRNSKELFPSIICNLWILVRNERKSWNQNLSYPILPCKLNLILHAPIFARIFAREECTVILNHIARHREFFILCLSRTNSPSQRNTL